MSFIFGNNTERSGWVSEPDKRGTFGILSACMATTLLCVWTALHLNVPLPRETRWHWYGSIRLWRKTLWLFLGLLAPDLVVYTAWYQFTEARKVLACKKRFEKTDSNDGEDKLKVQNEQGSWTMAHAYYAMMGGIVLQTRKAFLPGTKYRMTLTASGVRYLLEHHPEMVPYLREDDILDKSKASAFAKTLVCIQAAWFILQCVTRIATSLPISLLEINTFGHAIGALIIYVFWWHKPLDIEQPTIISSESYSAVENVLAYLYMTTKRLTVPYRVFYSEMPEAADMRWVPTSRPDKQNIGSSTRSTKFERISALTVWRRRVITWVTRLTLYQKVNDVDRETLYEERPKPCPRTGDESPVDISIADLLARRERTFLPRNVELQPTGLAHKRGNVTLGKSDALRWVLAMRLLKDTDPESLERDYSAEFVYRITDRVSDLPPLDLDPAHLDWHLLLAFNISSMLYGGLHALAWNAIFASESHKVLWRLSSVGVMGFFALSTLILYIERMLFHQPKAENVALKASYFILYRLELAGVMFCAGFLTFLAARTYLLVECYITLTDLPKEAYDMPLWSRFIPHV